MATCLVTGGAGFLGSHLCDELLRRGHRVICVDNVETGSLANIAHIRSPDFRFLMADIIQPYYVDEPVDVVYHFASPASPIDYLRLPLHTLKVGSHGTHHTLGVAKHKRARFLLASTSEVYGDPKEHQQPPLQPRHVQIQRHEKQQQPEPDHRDHCSHRAARHLCLARYRHYRHAPASLLAGTRSRSKGDEPGPAIRARQFAMDCLLNPGRAAGRPFDDFRTSG
jgi:nucleoside-diphosphate-sugar epimerase